jgi:drug/metabolite transporter (DMT)-like permease
LSVAPQPAHPEPRRAGHYAAFSGMCLIWGSTFLVIRIGNEAVAPIWAACLRLVIAFVLLVAMAVITRAPFPRGAALRGALLYGFLNLGVNFALLYWGEQRVPSGIAAVLYATMPLSTAIFSWAFRLHAINWVRTACALFGLLGVGLIFAGELKLGAPVAALLAVFAGATCASLSTVVLKKSPPQSPFTANAVGAVPGFLVCILASKALGESQHLPQSSSGWWPILYLAVLGSLGAYVLWAWLVTQWKATSVALSALVVPVLAVILGAIAKGESPAPGTYLGGLLVLGGVAVSLRVGKA